MKSKYKAPGYVAGTLVWALAIVMFPFAYLYLWVTGSWKLSVNLAYNTLPDVRKMKIKL